MHVLVIAAALAAEPTLLYVGSWPKTMLVIDEAKGAVVDRIPLQTDVARNLLLTPDRKKLIAVTIKDTAVETIDLATRKVVDSFVLGSATKKIRPGGVALDPTGRYLYMSITVANKLIDRFEVEKPKFAVVDLQEKKIVRTADVPEKAGRGGGRGQFRVSPDGKYLWSFRDNIYIFDTADFKLVDTIELERPQFQGMESIFLNPADDPHDEPGMMTAIFNASDPVVHKQVFGIAHINLTTRKIDFHPIGPVLPGVVGLRLSPDRKTGYTIAVSGEHGDRRCEFIVIDMTAHKITRRATFPGRTRFSFGNSTDGKMLIIYGAGNTLEFYDANTLQFVKELDVAADMTTPLVAVMPGAPTSAGR